MWRYNPAHLYWKRSEMMCFLFAWEQCKLRQQAFASVSEREPPGFYEKWSTRYFLPGKWRTQESMYLLMWTNPTWNCCVRFTCVTKCTLQVFLVKTSIHKKLNSTQDVFWYFEFQNTQIFHVFWKEACTSWEDHGRETTHEWLLTWTIMYTAMVDVLGCVSEFILSAYCKISDKFQRFLVPEIMAGFYKESRWVPPSHICFKIFPHSK